jgi:hypothetical protein
MTVSREENTGDFGDFSPGEAGHVALGACCAHDSALRHESTCHKSGCQRAQVRVDAVPCSITHVRLRQLESAPLHVLTGSVVYATCPLCHPSGHAAGNPAPRRHSDVSVWNTMVET